MTPNQQQMWGNGGRAGVRLVAFREVEYSEDLLRVVIELLHKMMREMSGRVPVATLRGRSQTGRIKAAPGCRAPAGMISISPSLHH